MQLFFEEPDGTNNVSRRQYSKTSQPDDAALDEATICKCSIGYFQFQVEVGNELVNL